MAQHVLSPPGLLELEERDQAGNLVARYITTSSGSSSRVDVVVSLDIKVEVFISKED